MTDMGEWAGDLGRAHRWPDGFSERLDSIRQGDVVSGVPLFFLDGANFELWQPARTSLSGPPTALAGPTGQPTFAAMVLTQACDLMKRRDPWITVAPVYPAQGRIDEGEHARIRLGAYSYLIPLSAPWCDGDLWVADLRLELAVEKSFLAEGAIRPGFARNVDYALLADALASRRNRPAVPQNCVDEVVSPLVDLVKAQPDAGTSLSAGVQQVRVQWNDPAVATIVTVFVILRENATTDEEGWHAVIDTLRIAAGSAGITINGPEFGELWDLTAADYLSSGFIGELTPAGGEGINRESV